MQPLSGNQRPATEHASFQILFKCPRLPSLLDMLENPHVLLTFDQVHTPLRRPRKTTSERPKVLRTCQFLTLLTWECASRHNGVHFFDISTSKVLRAWCALYILTWKCASRHNGVHFFDITTSKSGPSMVCFVLFDLEGRAIFLLSFGHMAPHPLLQRANFSTLRSHRVSRLCYFARLHLLSSHSFCALLFSAFLFSDSSHLCFSIWPYCRKFDF